MAVEGLHLVQALGHALQESWQIVVGNGIAVPSDASCWRVKVLHFCCSFSDGRVLGGVESLRESQREGERRAKSEELVL